jgi:hypothetical protein
MNTICRVSCFLFIAVFDLSPKLSFGQTAETPPFLRSQSIETFFFCLAGSTSNGVTTNGITPDEELIYSIRTTAATNDQSMVWVPAEPEYRYQVELLDVNGASVSKTDLGRKVGTKFFDFDVDAPIKGIKRQLTLSDAIERVDKGEVFHVMSLFRPAEYFKIEKPGIYTLRVRLQVYVLLRKGTKNQDYKPLLIRFSAVDYPVIKPSNSARKERVQ